MKFLIGPLLIFLTACSNDELPKYSALGDLRILALVVNTPELQSPSAGTSTVSLTPYLSDINGSGSVSLEIQSCLDPGVSLGVDPTCTNAQYASTVQTVTVSAGSSEPTGTFGTPERTGSPSTGSINVGLEIPSGLLANFSSALQVNGISYLITVKATSGSNSVKSFRRVLISNQTPNTNPVLTDLLSNGNTLTSLPTADAELSFATSSTAGTYLYMNGSGTLQNISKVFQTTWFVSDGVIANPRTTLSETTTWQPSSAPSGRKTVVVGVMRDGRGGTSVLIKAF